MYLTYEEYQNMGGTLDETTFNDFEFEAETYVDWYTFNRLQNVTEYPEKVKKCMYHIIKLAKMKYDTLSSSSVSGDGTSNTVGAKVTSQSNDGVSISYSVLSADTVYSNSKDEIKNIIYRYLVGVKDSLGRNLLYRGLYPGE